RDRLIEQSAGIVAKIEQYALEIVADFPLELFHGLFQALFGLLAKGGDADVAEITFAPPADGLDPDHVAGHLDIERRLGPATERGRIVDRRYDLHISLLHRHLDAEAAELAPRLHLHVAEALLVQIAGVGIERGEHAVDGRLDELFVRDLFDVIGADSLEDVAEKVQ